MPEMQFSTHYLIDMMFDIELQKYTNVCLIRHNEFIIVLFEEIIAVVALFRPGPMDNIPSFCNRKHGKEKIDYIHALLENVLKSSS